MATEPKVTVTLSLSDAEAYYRLVHGHRHMIEYIATKEDADTFRKVHRKVYRTILFAKNRARK